MCVFTVNLNRLQYRRLTYVLQRERLGHSPPIAIVTPMLVRVCVGQQTEGRFPPLRRWNPQPQVIENWESPPANLASSEGATQSDAATNVRPADIAETNVLIDMFVNGERLPANVTVQRRRSNVYQLFEVINVVIVD
jgi:hypothetical protein